VSLPDEVYVDGSTGASFDTAWIVNVANAAGQSNAGVFLVHSHGSLGVPRFSLVDARTNREVVVPLSLGVETAPYGAMVLSDTSATVAVASESRLRNAKVILVPDRAGHNELTT
jgi:hypothetical protein